MALDRLGELQLMFDVVDDAGAAVTLYDRLAGVVDHGLTGTNRDRAGLRQPVTGAVA